MLLLLLLLPMDSMDNGVKSWDESALDGAEEEEEEEWRGEVRLREDGVGEAGCDEKSDGGKQRFVQQSS